MNFFTHKRLAVLFILSFFLVVFYLYLHNLTKDVYAGDIGDIATAAYFFGVPHPPGYPTLTILGFIFSRLPIPIPVISRIALVSVVASIAGLFIFFLWIIDIFISVNRTNLSTKDAHLRTKINHPELTDLTYLCTAILSTAFLAFSYYYWLYAEVPEVFALNNFFLITLYYVGYLFYKTKKLKFLYLTSLVAGLSMTNQQAIMFAFPGLIVMVFPDLWDMIVNKSKTKEKGLVIKLKNMLYGVLKKGYILKNIFLAFLLGLTPYLYVFIAASFNPQINWMKQPTVYNFIRLILRMDYKFAENLVDIKQRIVVLGIYFSTLINTFSFVIFIIAFIGILYLFFKSKRLFFALAAGFLFAGPIFIFIITPEIIDPDELGIVERMFMHSFVLFSFFIPLGFLGLQSFFYKIIPRRIYSIVFLIPFVIVLLQMIYFNQPKTDLSKTKIGSNFAKDILSPLPKNSVVFLLGDLGTLNTWFVHYVEGFRKDIELAGSFGDRNDFENGIYNDFIDKNKKSNLKIETVVVRQLPEILKKRKVYSMFQFPLGRKDYMWVPRGLVFELMPVENIPDKKDYLIQSHTIVRQYRIAYREGLLPSEQNNIAPYMSKQYSNAFNHIGDFLYVRFNDLSSAYSYYSKAQKIDPQNPLSYAKLGIIQAEYPAQCSLAIENIDKSIEMYKIYRPYYTFALRIYNKCNVSGVKIRDLKNRYKSLFGKQLEKDPHY